MISNSRIHAFNFENMTATKLTPIAIDHVLGTALVTKIFIFQSALMEKDRPFFIEAVIYRYITSIRVFIF